MCVCVFVHEHMHVFIHISIIYIYCVLHVLILMNPQTVLQLISLKIVVLQLSIWYMYLHLDNLKAALSRLTLIWLSSCDQTLGSLQILAVMNNKAGKSLVCVFLWTDLRGQSLAVECCARHLTLHRFLLHWIVPGSPPNDCAV